MNGLNQNNNITSLSIVISFSKLIFGSFIKSVEKITFHHTKS